VVEAAAAVAAAGRISLRCRSAPATTGHQHPDAEVEVGFLHVSNDNALLTLRGGCHCGRVHVGFSTREDATGLVPRACDCAFCRRHGAAWVSDPAGRLRIEYAEIRALASCEQGSRAARFRLCAQCGVLVAVTYTDADRVFGAVNATCLDDPTAFGPPIPVSLQRLSREEKTGRWLRAWIPDVELVGPRTDAPPRRS
jgi:hypothetical protein